MQQVRGPQTGQPELCALILPSPLGSWPEKGGRTPEVSFGGFSVALPWLGPPPLYWVPRNIQKSPHILIEWPRLKRCPF